MPSFNQGKYIAESIKSVINQNYPNLEFFIIDGGSTDNTVDIIRQYEDHIDYWVSEKDKGQSHAINKGFRGADGGIINWLNSDDVLANNSLFKIGSFFQTNKQVDVIIGKSHLIDEKGYIIKVRNNMSYSSNSLWSLSTSMCQPAVFFRTPVLERTGLLDEKMNWVMDQDLYFRMDLQGFHIQRVPFLINFFRVYSNTKSATNREKFKKDLNYLLKDKYYNPIPEKIWIFYWLFYRTKRYMINIPAKIRFAVYSILKGKISYLEYQQKFNS